MSYSFDTIIPREKTNCYKYDLRSKVFGSDSVIPLWVADMDFKIADEIIHDISKVAEHGIFGYTFYYKELYDSLIQWNANRNYWHFTADDVIFYHGIVPSINLIIQEFTTIGDSIIIQTPVYFPFFQSIEMHNRVVLNNQLVLKDGKYSIDFNLLEESITENTKLMILCHPHNPVGRCWTKHELLQLHDICKRHNILVISDEIHADILRKGNKHIPWATLSDYAAQNSITLVAPSKTFNIAGLSISAIVCQNSKYISKIKKFIERNQLHGMSPLNMKAFESAYTNGANWLKELLEYLENNVAVLRDFSKSQKAISLIEPQATYLAWLDCRAMGMSDDELHSFFVHKAGVGLSRGIQFGKGGEGFMRLNYACPQAVLQKALQQISTALSQL